MPKFMSYSTVNRQSGELRFMVVPFEVIKGSNANLIPCNSVPILNTDCGVGDAGGISVLRFSLYS